MEGYRFNINGRVMVKLTPAGIERYIKKHNEVFEPYRKDSKIYRDMMITKMPSYTKSKKKNYYEFQLWELMYIFGSKMTMGFQDLMFEKNTIILLGE